MKHYIGTISSIKDSIILCDLSRSCTFIGEIVKFQSSDSSFIDKDLFCEGCVFEINSKYMKILLIKGRQEQLFIGDHIYGYNNTIKIKVGFSVLGKTITPFGRLLKENVSNTEKNNFLDDFFYTEYKYIV